MIRHHLAPMHVITDRVTGGAYIAYPGKGFNKVFGHGLTREAAIEDLKRRLKPVKLVVKPR